MVQKLPAPLQEAGIRLEVARTPAAHQDMVDQTRDFLSLSNVDSTVVDAGEGLKSLIIKPEPLDPTRPADELTALSKKLLQHGCVVHFHTGHYLSDIGVFNSVPKPELGGQSSLSVPWVELLRDGPLETLTLHEVRHHEQHTARQEFRNGKGPSFRPEVRVKFAEGSEPDNWVGRQSHYNGVAGHSIDEVDAYLHQSELHLNRAKEKSEQDPALAREDARKAVTCACKAFLFADTDSKALRVSEPARTPIDGVARRYLGDQVLTENGVGLFVDSRDFPDTDLIEGLNRLADELAADGRKARSVAGEALQLLSKDPGAVEAIQESLAQIKAVGWVK